MKEIKKRHLIVTEKFTAEAMIVMNNLVQVLKRKIFQNSGEVLNDLIRNFILSNDNAEYLATLISIIHKRSVTRLD